MHRRDFAFSVIAPAILKFSPRRRLTGIIAAEDGVNPPSSDFLQSLPLLMQVAEVPGIAMSVVREGRVVWQHRAGIADTKTGRAVAADTLWPAASLSKPVFALAVLRLVDAKTIELDRPLRTYLPGYAP